MVDYYLIILRLKATAVPAWERNLVSITLVDFIVAKTMFSVLLALLELSF